MACYGGYMRFVILLLLSLLPAFPQSLGRRAPGFSLPDLTLKQHDLQDYRGKIVIIEFMKTDCPNCQELSRRIEEVKAKIGDKVQVFSVVPAGADNQNTVRQFIASTHSTSTFLFDCGQMTASYLQITPQNPTLHLPRLLIVDKNGSIRRDLQTLDAMTPAALSSAVGELSK